MHTPLNKAFVALAMSILAILDLVFGAKIGLSEDIVTVVVAILTPLLVYLVPNAKAGSTSSPAGPRSWC